MPLFNFELKPLLEVSPWGQEGAQTLHWFGLTDGWYWMHLPLESGPVELMRFHPTLVKRRGAKRPYYDYQVVRFHEDLLSLLPHAIDPIPQDIVSRIDTLELDQRVQDVYYAWEEGDGAWPTYVHDDPESVQAFGRSSMICRYAFEWWRERILPGGHMAGLSQIRLSRVSDVVHSTIARSLRRASPLFARHLLAAVVLSGQRHLVAGDRDLLQVVKP